MMSTPIQQLSADQLQVRIYPDRTAMGEAAAKAVVAAIQKLLLQKKYVNIIFAAAPSQNELLAALAVSGLDWSRIRAFHMDEYIGLPADAPQGFGNFLQRALFDKVHLRTIYYLDGMALHTAVECQRYGDLLKKYPPDLVCMGIGENGHLAFNDPPVADFKDPFLVKVVELDHACRQQQVNDGCFTSLEEVPRKALTLTIPALMQAPEIFCVVPGQSKAEAVKHTLKSPITTQHPSTILRTHTRAKLYLDKAAAALLTLLCLTLTTLISKAQPYKLIIVAPEHFHAALIQRSTYPTVDSIVHVYAPAEGIGLRSYLNLVDGYNKRPDSPTFWKEDVYTGEDYLQKMLSEKKGNVVVLAGNNRLKSQYILQSVIAGLNVFADKPMVITATEFPALEKAFKTAKTKNVLLYDIMTERYQATNWLLRELMRNRDVFGDLTKGSPAQPAVRIEGVHHFLKTVSGKPLLRPDWYFDVDQQGDGIVDVSTHFIDLVQWQCFPDQDIDYHKDIKMLAARRWATSFTKTQFTKVTGEQEYPPFLQKDVTDSTLNVYANGEMNYTLKSIHIKVRELWNYEAPPGGGDTQYELVIGTKARLIISQSAEEHFIPELYIEPVTPGEAYTQSIKKAITALAATYPGIAIEPTDKGWKLIIPDRYRLSHEATFAHVAANYFHYLQIGKLPSWEVDGMLAKYYTTTEALKLALQHR